MTKRSKPLSHPKPQPQTETVSLRSAQPVQTVATGNDLAPERSDAAPDEAAFTPGAMPFFWPLQIASAMNASAGAVMKWYAGLLAGAAESGNVPEEPSWTTSNRVALSLPTMRLRDFSSDSTGQPTLICAPFALHGATIADFAPGHSVVAALLQSGVARLAVTEWRSAEPDMRYFSIDTYLADLNVVVDEMGAPVDLIGLCQGGWMALVYAARFPRKVRRLVLVGAPVDVRAAETKLMQNVDALPLAAFENLVRLGDGRVLGRYALKLWGSESAVDEAAKILQLPSGTEDPHTGALMQRFAIWHAWTVNLPGAYYMQVVREIFKENRIAEGRFAALGRVIDLRHIRAPMYLLAGSEDEVIAPEQLFAAAHLTSTPDKCVEMERAPCGHLGLFMGAETIAGAWTRIARWLLRDVGTVLTS